MDTVQFIEKEIKEFVRTSPLNRMPTEDNTCLFDDPLVQFADGDDPLFTQYKHIINANHLTPREAFGKKFISSPQNMPTHLSVISWILPITSKTRESNRKRKKTPSFSWGYTRWSEEYMFHPALREHVVKLITEMKYQAVAPVLEDYHIQMDDGFKSNWSERHIAYAAGLGTFGLSGGLITERGIAHYCGSVITNLVLPVSPRTAKTHYSNCLYFITGKCQACIVRCPAGSISEKGHDILKCLEYMRSIKKLSLIKKYNLEKTACGLCLTRVPCEFRNPAQLIRQKI